MKLRFLHLIAFLPTLAGNPPAIASVGLLPEEKQPVRVVEGERNPFGKKGPKTPIKTDEDTESEEARIRNILAGLTVAGLGEREGEVTALLGSFVLKPGDELPPILRDQKEIVRVLQVKNNLIELGFVDKDGSAETRKISLNIKTKPTVRYDLGIRAAKPAAEGTDGVLSGTIQVHEDSPKEP